MQIYSLNARYNSSPITYSADVTDGEVTFPTVVLPVDGNQGPLAIFTIQVDADEDVQSIRINGLVPEHLSSALDVAGVNTCIAAVRFFAPSYEVTVTLADDFTGTATLVGYTFGNVASITAGGEAEDSFSTDEDEIVVSGAGALDDNVGVMQFSLFAMGAWAEGAATVATAASTGLTFTYPLPANESWPNNAVCHGSNVSRVAVAILTEELATLGSTTWSFTNAPYSAPYDVAAFTLTALALPDAATTSFNCECEDEAGMATLAALRRRMLIRLGYAAQADNPPPGMADLLNDFLYSGQKFLYDKFTGLRTERFYRWTMQEGVRFYDLDANEDECTKRMDAYKITWVGVEDLNGWWGPMTQGIPPEFYTTVNYNGLPQRYEIRQCIEVWPPPSAGYTLRIKAHFGLQPFADDADRTTIDSELVFLWALANAKNHYGQNDATDIATQANAMLGNLTAGMHQTARYVPGTRPAVAATPPIFLPLLGPP
jgi:hypothetical protein